MQQHQELGGQEEAEAVLPDAPFAAQHGASSVRYRDFRELGTGTPRLERARAHGATSSLVAGRGQATPATAALLQREYALRHALRDEWAAVPVALVPHGESFLLILKDPGGEPLRRSAAPCTDVGAFLALALRLTAAVGAMHADGVLHRALTPERMLLGEDGRACLTGFGRAAAVGDPDNKATGDDQLSWDEDSFNYMAPELGARMNLRVDARADLYALGCILYELMTGRLPLEGADAAARVHAHATRIAPAPGELVPELPEQLSLLVMKLLEKTPGHRYADAAGVLADLRRCETLLRQHGRIPRFALDAHSNLRKPGGMGLVLGRDAELQTLLALYRTVADSARARAAWVSGPSGIGKSTLLREAVARMQRSGTPLLATAKSEEGRRGKPYALLVEVLDPLLQHVIGCANEEFAAWRSRIAAAAKPVERTLAGLLPALGVILGLQSGQPAPASPDAAPALERERVLQGMARLIACFAAPSRPLVMLLDDLQWADVETLQVIERLLHQHDDAALLLVGTFRDNEVGADHPLRAGRLAEVTQSVRIELGPLDEGALREMIAVTLQQDASVVGELAELIGRKTERNPLFARHLLHLLADDGLLAYDAETASWRWSLKQLASHPGADTVGDLMARRFEQLPSATQAVLRVMACLGHRTSGEALALAMEVQPGTDAARRLQAALDDAREAGSIQRDGEDWVFWHDRIREAAYGSIPPGERPRMHLRSHG